jgi:hypothetical protein
MTAMRLCLFASVLFPLANLDAQVNAAKPCQPFFSNTLYLPDQNPNIQVGDFNSDGIPDIAAVTYEHLTILIGKGDGTFRTGRTFDLPKGSNGRFAVGDFNGDGKLDVAVAGSSALVSVLLGNGDGTFQKPVTSPIADYTSYLAVGDFNGDGNLDLAAVSQGGASVVQVLLGNGDGSFQPPVSHTVDNSPSGIAVADFNGDGHLDLAVSNAGYMADPGHTVSVLLGKGDGTFGPKKDFQTGNQPFGIATADLNGDGKADLATANYDDGTASVLLGKGDGTFARQSAYPAGHPFAPYSIAAVPFDAGGQPGLAVATVAGTFMLINKGDGTFQSGPAYDPGSFAAFVADFNGDGKADLALAAGLYDTGSGVAVLLGLGHGKFTSSTAYVGVPNMETVAEGDFNGDGVPDLVVGELDDPYLLGVLHGLGKGRFSPVLDQYFMPGPVVAIGVGDLNGDGKLDLAVVIQGPNEVQIMLGNGDGSFTVGRTFKLVGTWPSFIWLADFNGDGKLDIAVTGTGDYESDGDVSILLGNGDGTFQKAKGYAPEMGLSGLIVADFNGDGNLDFAVADNVTKNLRIFLGNGKGGFQAGPQTPLGVTYTMASSDFNGDGKLDLALIEAATIHILLGNGDGTFTAGAAWPSLNGFWLTAADFNGDGKTDLALLSGDSQVQLFAGNGDGTFGSRSDNLCRHRAGKREFSASRLKWGWRAGSRGSEL